MGFVNERKGVIKSKIKPEYPNPVTDMMIHKVREVLWKIASNEQGEDRLYGIKGISNSVANTLQRNLPVQIETVLLPFKGKTIYDSFMSTMPIGFAACAKAAFREMYDKAIKHGIITSLEE